VEGHVRRCVCRGRREGWVGWVQGGWETDVVCVVCVCVCVYCVCDCVVLGWRVPQGRIRQESKRLEAQADLIQDQLNAVQTSIFKGTERVEQFKVGWEPRMVHAALVPACVGVRVRVRGAAIEVGRVDGACNGWQGRFPPPPLPPPRPPRPQITMSFNQEELDQWATAAKQKEEDSLALAK
jgi:hypothetical protein